jgi:hypothetical protein
VQFGDGLIRALFRQESFSWGQGRPCSSFMAIMLESALLARDMAFLPNASANLFY